MCAVMEVVRRVSSSDELWISRSRLQSLMTQHRLSIQSLFRVLSVRSNCLSVCASVCVCVWFVMIKIKLENESLCGWVFVCMLACRSPASLLSGVGEMETMVTLCGELAKMGGGSWRKRSRQQERKSEKKKIAEDEHKGKEERGTQRWKEKRKEIWRWGMEEPWEVMRLVGFTWVEHGLDTHLKFPIIKLQPNISYR